MSIFNPRTALATAILFISAASASAQSTSPNTGSLGAGADGTNAAGVTFGPGAVGAGGDQAAFYNEAAGTNTRVEHNPALNPADNLPFSIEFWAQPTGTDGDDAVLSNRVSASPRSGWVFFQRGETTGWNFVMYNGNGSTVGVSLTGGTSTLNAWSHVVATWSGGDNPTAKLFVNGDEVSSFNATLADYAANTAVAAPLVIATNDANGSPYLGWVDEVAFYNTALSGDAILGHYNTALGRPFAYHEQVRDNGALLQLSNNPIPEPSSLALLGLTAGLLLRRRTMRA